MKTTMAFLALLLPDTFAQDYTQMNLPDGAVARFGKGYIEGIQYYPDGARFAVHSSTGIWLYDTETYRAVALLVCRPASIWSIAFSPDGTTLAGGGTDNTVRLWDVKTGELKGALTGHTKVVYSVVFSPDSKTLASGSGDGTVLLWKVDYSEFKK